MSAKSVNEAKLDSGLAEKLAERGRAVREEIARVVVGQTDVVNMVLLGLLADGHMLLEGLPGLAKTLLFRTLAQVVNAKFQRVQFTPDLLPADITGITVYNANQSSFSVKKGPIFANLVLADEINRAPAKVQSALLEAMEERQVTIGETTFALPQPFLVLATQNPIEQEGTYALPEAQIDRFMMKLHIGFPSREEEAGIIARMGAAVRPEAHPVLSVEEILQWRAQLPLVYLDSKVEGYILDLIFATRQPADYGLQELQPYISHGVSPRATLALIKASRAQALMQGRNFVTPDDVKTVAYPVLRHRLAPSYEAQAADVGSEELVRRILDQVRVP